MSTNPARSGARGSAAFSAATSFSAARRNRASETAGAARKASNRATSWWSRPAGGESAVNAHFTRPVVRMRRASEGASSRVNAAITGGSSARSETSPTSCEGQSVSAVPQRAGIGGTRREDACRRGGWLVGEGVGDRSWQRADHGAAYRFGFIPEGARPPTHMNPREIPAGFAPGGRGEAVQGHRRGAGSGSIASGATNAGRAQTDRDRPPRDRLPRPGARPGSRDRRGPEAREPEATA